MFDVVSFVCVCNIDCCLLQVESAWTIRKISGTLSWLEVRKQCATESDYIFLFPLSRTENTIESILQMYSKSLHKTEAIQHQ